MNISTLSDQELLTLSEKYGLQARLWRQKFLGLLPEVFKRKLYLQKGCSSIIEFGKKFAGLSEETVSRALNLEKRFAQTPVLKSLLEEGKVSMHKLARVASVATKDNEKFLAEQVQILPKKTLETLVRDLNMAVPGHNSEHQNQPVKLLEEPLEDLELDPVIHQKLLALKKKGIDLNAFLEEVLQQREQNIRQEKQRLAAKQEQRGKSSRHMPKAIQDLLHEEYGTKCALPHCYKPSEEIHHTARYALIQNHNPFFLAPLCEDHHHIAHSIDQKVHEHRTRALLLATGP